MLDHNATMPAFVMGRRWDVLAWNHAARAFFFDFEQVPADERNMVWLYFTNSALRSLIVDWPTRARDAVARFRADYGCHAGDSNFVELIERLNSVSPEFAQWWPRHDILPLTEGCEYPSSASGAHPRRAHDVFGGRQSRSAARCVCAGGRGEFDQQDAESYRCLPQRCASDTCPLIDLAAQPASLARVNPTSSAITLYLYPYRRSPVN